MPLKPEAGVLAGGALWEFASTSVENFVDAVIGVMDLWGRISHIIFGYHVGGIFDDSRPTTYTSNTEYNTNFRLNPDIPLATSDYDYSAFFENGQTHISGGHVARNTFLLFVFFALLVRFGPILGKKIKVMALSILERLTGVKSRLTDIENKIDILLDAQANELSSNPQESPGMISSDDALKHIIEMLSDGDRELTSLMNGLATDNRNRFKSINWGEDSFNPYAPPTSEDV